MESLKGLTLHQVRDFVKDIVKNQESKYNESLRFPCSSATRNSPIDFSALRDHITRTIAKKSYKKADDHTRKLTMNYICRWCRTEDKQYFCPNDSHYYSTEFKYKAHLRESHFKSSPKASTCKIPCEICGKPVPKPSMKSHMRSHASLEVLAYKCDPCGKTFRSKLSLRDHINTKHNNTRIYPCPYCQKQCLTTHIRSAHVLNIHVDKRDRFKCTECPEFFKRKAKLTSHILLKHPDPSSFVDSECLQCKQKFQTPYQLKIHKPSCPATRQKVECPICSKNISTKLILDDHIRTHTRELPYKCDAPGCGKRFRTNTNLVQHSKTHKKDKPYSCPECKLQFRLPHHLRNHLKTITHAKTVDKLKEGEGIDEQC